MRVLTKHSVSTILKIGILTSLIGSLLLIGVELFKNLDTYINYSYGFANIFKLSVLYFPEALILAISPSFLFAVTYYISSLKANNEMITIYNSGVSYRKVIIPCIITGIFISAFYLCFNERVAVNTKNKRNTLNKNLSNSTFGELDNSNIFFNDTENNYILFADQYVDENQTLYSVVFTKTDGNSKIVQRMDAYKASWNEENKSWHLYNTYILTYDENSDLFENKFYNETDLSDLQIEPQFFKNSDVAVSDLPLKEYSEYVSKIQKLNPDKYAVAGTDYYSRLLSCLTPLVLIIISCFSSFNFRKNVLFFSIIASVCFAVVYYVIRILTILFASQGVIAPALGTLIPFICVVFISLFINLIINKQ